MRYPLGAAAMAVTWSVAVLTALTGLALFLVPATAGGRLWPWPLTPLVSRYLGALFIGVAVGATLAARANDWSQVRLLFPPGLTFTGLSLLAAVLHFSSFNPSRITTWLFIGIYVVVFMGGLIAYVRNERRWRAKQTAVPRSQRERGT